MKKKKKLRGELDAQSLSRRVDKARRETERTFRLVKDIESRMREAESNLHAAEKTLDQTKSKARNLHRTVRRRQAS